MSFQFPGGIETVDIDDTGSFDTGAATDPSSWVVTIDKKNLDPEQSEFPDPEALTAAFGDDREGRLGLNQPLTVAATKMDMTDFGNLEDGCIASTDLYVRVTSQATTSGGSPLYVVTYAPVVLSNATLPGAKVSREAYGTYTLAGMVTGYRSADLMSVVTNP